MRYLRWFALSVSLAIEAIVFWIAGPHTNPAIGFWESVWIKAQSGAAWTWVGWVSFSLFWLTHEIVRGIYTSGLRTRRFASKNTEVDYETGLHWLVLLRDFKTGKLNDGDETELHEPLFDKIASGRSFTWYAIWIPISLAILTLVFYIGWVAWLVATLPETVHEWSNSIQDYIDSNFKTWPTYFTSSLKSFFFALPPLLTSFRELAREETLRVLLAIIVIWIVVFQLKRLFRRIFFPIAFVLRLGGYIAFIALVFAILSVKLFDGIWPIYAILPQNSPVSMGFFLLTFANIYYLPHLMCWSSWRYAIVRNIDTGASRLIIYGGVLAEHIREVIFTGVIDFFMARKLWERILGIGSITLTDSAGREDKFSYIDGARQFYVALHEHARPSAPSSSETRSGESEGHGRRAGN